MQRWRINRKSLPSGWLIIAQYFYNGKRTHLCYQGKQQHIPKVFVLLNRTELFQNQVKDFAFHKKGQPWLNTDHIKAIKIPDIPIDVQKSIIDGKVSKIEKQISSLQQELTQESSIIDNVFAKSFGFDYARFNEMKRENNTQSVILALPTTPICVLVPNLIEVLGTMY